MKALLFLLVVIILATGCIHSGSVEEIEDNRPPEMIELENKIQQMKEMGIDSSEVEGFLEVAEYYYFELNDTGNATHYCNSGLVLANYLLGEN